MIVPLTEEHESIPTVAHDDVLLPGIHVAMVTNQQLYNIDQIGMRVIVAEVVERIVSAFLYVVDVDPIIS